MAYKGFKGIGPRRLGTSPLKQTKTTKKEYDTDYMPASELRMMANRMEVREGDYEPDDRIEYQGTFLDPRKVEERNQDDDIMGPKGQEGPMSEDQEKAIQAFMSEEGPTNENVPKSVYKGFHNLDQLQGEDDEDNIYHGRINKPTKKPTKK
jgi:hypothetical protein|tara:strand:- start:649 stop:1101 length:453 start_codon:yes stop_codon:yes gene_type:complete